MANILNNEKIVLVFMGVISFLVTQGLKWALIKPFTQKLNTRVKTLINSVILIIAFGAAVLCEYLYSHFWLKSVLDLQRASHGWGYASGIYGVIEVFIKLITNKEIKLENAYKTKEGTAVAELVEKVTEDNKINESDNPTVKDFVDNLNKLYKP